MRRSDFIFKYRVRNWSEYNKALISRGSLTLWVDEQAVSASSARHCAGPRSPPDLHRCRDRVRPRRQDGVPSQPACDTGVPRVRCPTDGGRPRHDHLQDFHNHLVMQAGAYQNGTWVVGVAKAGTEEGCDLIGGSCIIAPTGEIVARCESLGDELIVHECDLDRCKEIQRNIYPWWGGMRRILPQSLARQPEQVASYTGGT